jgi:NAD(P)-dependent dehydrogenase (short-subunit alcohol dehydrogenase family)
MIIQHWITTTSTAARIHGNFGQSDYEAAKSAVVGLMNVLAFARVRLVRRAVPVPEAAPAKSSPPGGAGVVAVATRVEIQGIGIHLPEEVRTPS